MFKTDNIKSHRQLQNELTTHTAGSFSQPTSPRKACTNPTTTVIPSKDSLITRELSSPVTMDIIDNLMSLTYSDILKVILSYIPSNLLPSIRCVSQLFRFIINTSNRLILKYTTLKLFALPSQTLTLLFSETTNAQQPLKFQSSLGIKLSQLTVNEKISRAQDIKELISFIHTPLSKPFLQNLEAIALGDVIGNTSEIRELLELLTSKVEANQLSKLTSLSFGIIYDAFTLPKLPVSITALFFRGNRSFLEPFTISEFPPKLIFLSFGSFMCGNFTLPEELPANPIFLSYQKLNTIQAAEKLQKLKAQVDAKNQASANQG